eukprot:2491087-Rhodomonas_salina.3
MIMMTTTTTTTMMMMMMTMMTMAGTVRGVEGPPSGGGRGTWAFDCRWVCEDRLCCTQTTCYVSLRVEIAIAHLILNSCRVAQVGRVRVGSIHDCSIIIQLEDPTSGPEFSVQNRLGSGLEVSERIVSLLVSIKL